ncbi:hypothetical protein MHF_0642 [Mycoplasma haemofelis Ohio2]|uniref:Uncharacterized protein n=1 Tax=Mycoplasma haemofelis (strain Ohio2) TaxID=859194 RepID=F6FI66_MYCHI|nr:hypothetical protein MHF_0642 [Mycoplasma haemofelis Ohio2]
MSVSTAKMAAALGGAGAVGTGGYFAVKNLPSTPVSIKESLLKEEYELISGIESKEKREGQYKTTFLAYASDSEFLREINKHKGEGADLTSSDGDKGKLALEKLCSSYLSSTDTSHLKNSQKWCVLRIMDKEVSDKTWISLADSGSEAKWKSSFTANKNLLISLGIDGINNSTDENAGHPKVKEWCTKNTKLVINKENKNVADSAYQICTEAKQAAV